MIYLELLWSFLKIGTFAFGGGYGMIAMMKQEVINNNWLSEEMLYNFIGVSESTPGPIAINLATFIGSSTGGLLGAIIATFSVILPSFILILLILSVFSRYSENYYVKAVLNSIKTVVVALIVVTGLFIVITNFVLINGGFINPDSVAFDYRSLIIMATLGALILFVNTKLKRQLSPILIIVIAAGLGMIIY